MFTDCYGSVIGTHGRDHEHFAVTGMGEHSSAGAWLGLSALEAKPAVECCMNTPGSSKRDQIPANNVEIAGDRRGFGSNPRGSRRGYPRGFAGISGL